MGFVEPNFTLHQTPPQHKMGTSHFVLVHGSGHGAWCWYKVATLLRSAGYRVSALDMAASGVHPKLIKEVRSISDYCEPLMEFMAGLPPEDRVILVGHSMENFPEKIVVAVFVTAIMPGPHLNLLAITQEYNRGFDSYMDSQFTFDHGPDKPPTTLIFGPKFLSSKLYQLSPTEDLTLANMLMRPFAMYYEDAETTILSQENFGSVRRVYVVSEQDNVFKEDLQRWMIQNNPTDEVKFIFGSDHMVMFSKPQDLFSYLQSMAEHYF